MLPPTILLMLKAPRRGEVKTRLGRAVGDEAALQIYCALVEHQLAALPPAWPVEIWFTPADAGPEMIRWLGPAHRYEAQCVGDLGARLEHAFAQSLARTTSGVCALGADCPAVDRARLQAAAGQLVRADVVLGPAVDGGYYLIGLRRAQPELFRQIAWSTASVAAQTREIARSSGLTVAELPREEDVDDLASWTRQRPRLGGRAPALSSVPPAALRPR